MLSNAARLLMVSAAASLVALGSAPAEACQDIADEALDIVALGTPVSTGAQLFKLIQQNLWGYTDDDIALLWGSPSPSSAVYYNNGVNLVDVAGTDPGDDFTPITNIASVAPGDVLVLNSTGSYSGHTAIVRLAPTQLTNALKPFVANTTQWVLPIVDSTTSVHGCSTVYPDSRFTPSAPGSCVGTFTAGPGTAFMRIYADATTGAPVGHTWSVTSGGTYYAQTGTSPPSRPFVIARQQSCPLL
ncbi:hypothetical protein [Sorangium sp. So ce861]|uniref:hypothetical protein n=1 Tax=Sorangium sp. So ce861 TaxID=3133323 RepID=UPI003F637561